MHAYLDRLCRALTERDAVAIRELLSEPMADTLPVSVRAEATAFAAHPARDARAPLQAFVFAHRMAQLMAATGRPAPTSAPTPRPRSDEPLDAARPVHAAPRPTRRATAA